MKKIVVAAILVFTGCEINDVEVIDFETVIPSENDPFIVEEDLTVETVTHLNTGSIVFAGKHQNTDQWYIGIRKVTGTTLIRDIEYTLYPRFYDIGSAGDKIVMVNANNTRMHVYDENLEWEDSYEVNSSAYATGHNKVTWSDGEGIYQLSPTGFQSTVFSDPEGGTVFYPQSPTDFIHTPSYTFVQVRVMEPSYPYNESRRLVKYNQALGFMEAYEINSESLLFANDNYFYTYSGSELYRYSINGERIESISGFSIPDANYLDKRKLLGDDNLAVLYKGGVEFRELKVLSVDTRELLWSLPLGEGERAWAFDVAQEGKVLVATLTTGYGQGHYYSIYLVDPDY